MNFVETYQNQGYLELKGYIDESVIQEIKDEIERIITMHPHVCTYEDWRKGNQYTILHKISKFVELSSLFHSLAYQKEILDMIEAINGQQSYLCTDKINFKLPGGRGFFPHQDMAGEWRKHTTNIVSYFLAIDESNEEDGCLYVAPKRHKEGLMGPPMKAIDSDLAAQLEFVPILQKPGDLLLFDGYLPHRSNPNGSSLSRRTLLYSYTKTDIRHLFLG